MRPEDILLRPEDKVLHVEDKPFSKMSYLCTRKPKHTDMDVTTIITTALATVVLLLIVGLALGLAYYRWRTSELLSGFREFLLRNRRLEDEVERLSRELEMLKSKQDKVK